ncbi:MAG: citrate/2-methylcitrate synthase [Gemmatimonadota bacterium]
MSTRGLEGVVAAQTELSKVYGEEGRLIYRGYEIGDLAEHTTFEEVCHLLWNGDLPDAGALDALRGRFAEERSVDDRLIELLRGLPRETHPMAALRTAVSAAGCFDPDAEKMDQESNRRKALSITAKAATLTAAWQRIREGKDPVAPSPELGHAENLLYMMTGERPDEISARTMDVALILHAEHGMNASTFSARVTIATLSDMYSAVTTALGTLKGPLHGGANQRVMKMLHEIGEKEAAEAWVMDALGRGEKIMGFGHRVYRALDPRARILRRMAEELGEREGQTRWIDLSSRVAEVMGEEMERRGKPIYPNVDFYSASVYYTMGIPTDLFTNIFACARAAGWTAHVLEQLADNRLIRPRAEYVGATDRTVRPIEQRG